MRIIPAMVEHVRRYCASAGVEVDILLQQDAESKASQDIRPRLLFTFGDPTGNVGLYTNAYVRDSDSEFGAILENWTCLCTAYNPSDINNAALQHEACSVLRDLLFEALNASDYGFYPDNSRQTIVSRSKTYGHGMGIRVTGYVVQPMLYTVATQVDVFPWTVQQTTVVNEHEIETLEIPTTA